MVPRATPPPSATRPAPPTHAPTASKRHGLLGAAALFASQRDLPSMRAPACSPGAWRTTLGPSRTFEHAGQRVMSPPCDDARKRWGTCAPAARCCSTWQASAMRSTRLAAQAAEEAGATARIVSSVGHSAPRGARGVHERSGIVSSPPNGYNDPMSKRGRAEAREAHKEQEAPWPISKAEQPFPSTVIWARRTPPRRSSPTRDRDP